MRSFLRYFFYETISLIGLSSIGIWLIGKLKPGIEKKRNLIYLLSLILSFLLSCSYSNKIKSPAPQPTVQPDAELFSKPERLIGDWVLTATLPAVILPHFNFFDSGEFQYNIGSDLCVIANERDQMLAYSGRWSTKGDTLVLSLSSKTFLKKGGARAIQTRDCGTKKQRETAIIEEINLAKNEEIVFSHGQCSDHNLVKGCEIYTVEDNRYVRDDLNPTRTTYPKLKTVEPLIFGNYQINLPAGWGWQEPVAGVIWGGPGTFCSDPATFNNPPSKEEEKCSYALIKDLSQNCPTCPFIEIADVDGLTMGGGGYITTINDPEKLGAGNYRATYDIIWRAVWPDDDTNVVKDKEIDENGNPGLYYIKGCPRDDLCIYFNFEGDQSTAQKVKDFINALVISEK